MADTVPICPGRQEGRTVSRIPLVGMSVPGATPVSIDWREPACDEAAISLGLVRQIAEPRSDLRCPGCRGVIYTRRHKLCGVCGEELPGELLFSESQALRIEGLLKSEREQHRAWMRKERF